MTEYKSWGERGLRERDRDARLIAKVLKGNKASFDVLILKYQHRIAKLISRYLHDPQDMMDVTQEVFIKAYRSLHLFRGDSAFYTWLYRIAINSAKNHLLESARRPIESEISLDDPRNEVRIPKLKEDASPENLLLTDEIEAAVYKVLESLPEDLRMAIILREIEGFSYEEIAEVMQCPIGTVRSRLFRAREAIDQILKSLLDKE